MKKLLVLAAIAAATTASAASAAVTFTTFTTNPHTAGKNYTNFNGGTSGSLSLTGGQIVDSTTGNHAAPAGSDGKYYSVGPFDGTPGVLTLSQGAYTLSFLYGSIDAYNSITFKYAEGSNIADLTFTGEDFAALANGSQSGSDTNKYIQFNLGNTGDKIRSVEFGSGQDAFEIDNLYVNAVPEPAAWALMIAGFGVIGGALRTRSRRATAFA